MPGQPQQLSDPTPHIAKVDQSGTLLWDRTDPVIQGLPRDEYSVSGGFDVDAAGNLYVIERQGTAVYRYHDDGASPATRLPLTGAFPSPADAPYKELRHSAPGVSCRPRPVRRR